MTGPATARDGSCLEGRTVLVTGAGKGVGRGLALALAAAGAGVVVTARGESGAAVTDEIMVRGGSAAALRCDVTSRADIEAAVSGALRAFGRLDAVIHNATSNRSNEPVDLERAPRQLWDEHAAASLRAPFWLARAAAAPLADVGGSLLLLTSPAGVHGSRQLSFYAAVKGGQRAFVKSLAREWGPAGVRVNGLAPLAVTPALEGAFDLDPALRERVTVGIPLRRIGDPETDIGPPAVFLCGDGARYITGQTLVVSGGHLTAL